MSKRDGWLEPRAYRRLKRREYRRERLVALFMQRMISMLVIFVAVAIMLALHPYFSGQP